MGTTTHAPGHGKVAPLPRLPPGCARHYYILPDAGYIGYTSNVPVQAGVSSGYGRSYCGDTKTKKSRRSLGILQRCIDALRTQRERQDAVRTPAGNDWQEHNLVFASEVGTELHAANVRRDFRKIAKKACLVAEHWTPRELRHSFVSLLSDGGLSIEQISRLVGHSSTAVTETVYRHQLNPVVEDGATVMDRILPTTAA